MSEITFPQPVAPDAKLEYGTPYFVAIPFETRNRWDAFEVEKAWRAAGLIYLTEAERDQRLAYDAQENAKRIVPQFVRDLGPEVEAKWPDGEWRIFHVDQVKDWRGAKPEHYRAKPKQVVRVIDGVEYRWAETLSANEIHKAGYYFADYKHSLGWFAPVAVISSSVGGTRSHATIEDCQAQCDALNAVLGVSDA